MPTPKLALHNISQSYREAGQRLQAITDINLNIDAGEFVTVIGPSGCGKSTLLKIIAGLQQPDSGTIAIDGKTIRRRAGQTSYMPQDNALLPWRTVINNVVIGAEVKGMNVRKVKQRARELLPQFGLEGFADAFPSQLSGGMKQRAAFLRTFLLDQDVILLDEPFGALDALTRRELHQWLLDVWRNFDSTILFVTHDVEEAIYLADKVVVMSPRPGTIVEVVDIPFARPRRENIEPFSPEMVELEARLMRSLKGDFSSSSDILSDDIVASEK